MVMEQTDAEMDSGMKGENDKVAHKPPSRDEGEGDEERAPQIPPREKLIGANRTGARARTSGMDDLIRGTRGRRKDDSGRCVCAKKEKQEGSERIKKREKQSGETHVC